MTEPSEPADEKRRRRLPGSVALAIASLVIVVLVQAALVLRFSHTARAGWAAYAAFLLLFALLIGGLVQRSRLAWLWSRYLTLVLGLVVGGGLVKLFHDGKVVPSTLAFALGGLALPLVASGLALGRRSAYPYFDLVCPTCAARTGIGDDLLFRKARCPTCGEVW